MSNLRRPSETTAAPVDLTRIAVLIPCYNEELTVGQVIQDVRSCFAGAKIYVFDNASTDRTSEVARQAGVEVVFSPLRGKGNVIQHMFLEVEADWYVMLDGDCTYSAQDAYKLFEYLLAKDLDMVSGKRLDHFASDSFRSLHHLGNRIISGFVSHLFGIPVQDILSGLKVMNRRFVKGIPVMSDGFEIETELTLQAITKRFKIGELPIQYGSRPEGSVSKLKTYSDGLLIFKLIFLIFKNYKPFVFFGWFSGLFFVASLIVGSAPVLDFIHTGYVTHVPRAILASGLAVSGMISFAIALILDSIYKYHQEQYQLWKRLFKKY